MNNKPILFRCSSLGKLLTEPKLKTEKDAGKLSETAKTHCLEVWLRHKYGYRERVMTDAMYKGLICEQDNMELVQKVLGGEFRVKNKINFVNEFISGTPDNLLKVQIVDDLKTSENIRTFYQSGISKDYEAQLQGYMALTGFKKSRLIYGLVPTPFEIITNAKKRLFYQFDCNEENLDYIEACNQIDHNNDLILQIPEKKRVKVFEIGRNEEIIENIYDKVKKAREYILNTFENET